MEIGRPRLPGGWRAGAAALALALASAAHAAPMPGGVAVVSLLQGAAEVRPDTAAAWRPLALHDRIGRGAEVRMVPSAEGRLELTLPDRSRLRLKAPARIRLDTLAPAERGGVLLRLLRGHAWSSVRKALSGIRHYRIATGTAVLGVRGTRFDTAVAPDRSVDVRLFTGSVGIASPSRADRVEQGVPTTGAVRPPREIAAPREIAPPREVSLHDWLLVLKSMQRLHITADGTPGRPAAMEMARQMGDPWIRWNLERDRRLNGNE
ncbi:MAG: hypothetical protein D6682_02435 [Zetaproteobacteria bacterium]|nr:MAG: hypothetical protein D6682_02435 [Zetaproteobacteria bacterium]